MNFAKLKKIIWIAGGRYVTAGHAQRAVLLTYYTLFAIVPMAALLFGIAKGFALEKNLQEVIEIRAVNHRELLLYINRFAERTLAEASGGVIAGIGVIALLWTVIWLITNIEKAFNAVWDLPSGRSWWRKLSNCLSLTLFTPFLIIMIGAAGVMMQRSLLRLAETYPVLERLSLTNVLAEVVTVIFVFLMFTALYRGAPNTRVRFSSALLAGLIAGIAFVLLQNSFLLLQKKVFSYNRLYGGFAALPLFLVWMNWSWQIVLFGAEISFVSQNIDSGIFEDDREKERSLRLCREHQLAIIGMVFRNFAAGHGALDEKKIFTSLRLPESILRQELSELLEKKILCRTLNDSREMAFLPGVPPEHFTILDFLRTVHGRGDDETPAFAVFEQAFCKIEQEIAGGRLDIPIIEIENNTEKES